MQRDRLPAVTDMWLVSLADENNSIVLLNYTTLIQLRKKLTHLPLNCNRKLPKMAADASFEQFLSLYARPVAYNSQAIS